MNSTTIKSLTILLVFLPSISNAVPWCHQKTSLIFPSTSQKTEWSGAQLQNRINITSLTCVPINNSHYDENCSAHQAIEKYCIDTYGTPNGMPVRQKWAIPNGGYNYSISMGASFQCEVCNDGKIVRHPRKIMKNNLEMAALLLLKKPAVVTGSVAQGNIRRPIHTKMNGEKLNKIIIKRDQYLKVNKKQSVVHSHQGRRHSHILPKDSKTHIHGNGASRK